MSTKGGAPPRPLTFPESAVTAAIASCTAEAFSYPFEFAKTRLQLQSPLSPKQIKGSFGVFKDVRSTHPRGLIGVYDGLKPALLRQATYGTLKMVLYQECKTQLDSYAKTSSGTWLTPTVQTLLAGVVAGACSSAICTPSDVIKVRMAAGDQYRYTGLWHAISSIVKDGGVAGAYRGWIPTTQRAMLVTLLNVSAYDICKMNLLELEVGGLKDDVKTHFIASMFASLVSVYGSQPVDTVKSRVMNSQMYAGSLNCLIKTVTAEGAAALWKGSAANFYRTSPWIVVFWLSYEKLTAFVRTRDPRDSSP